MLLLLVVASLSAVSVRAAPAAGRPVVTVYSSADTHHDGKLWAIRQDRDGVLHFGANGVVSFDGVRWRHAPIPGSYASRALDFAPDGRLWVGAFGEVGWYEPTPHGLVYHSLVDRVPAEFQPLGEIFAVHADRSGATYVGEDKVLHWDGHAFQGWSVPEKRHLFSVRSGNRVFVHQKSEGLFEVRTDGLHRVIPAAVLGTPAVFWLDRPEVGGTVFTSAGLFAIESDRLRPIAPKTNAEIGVPKNISGVTPRPSGGFIVSTMFAGIYVLAADGSIERHVTETDGLPTNEVYTVFLDREGEVWATSASSVFHFGLQSTASVYTPELGLPKKSVRALALFNDDLVVGTETGAYEIPAKGRLAQRLPELPTPTDFLHVSGAQMLAASTWKIARVTAGGTASFYSVDRDLQAFQPSRLRPGTWLIVEARSIRRLDAAGQTTTVAVNLPDLVNSIAEAEDGTLWLGTEGRGAYLLSPDGTIRAAAGNGLPSTTGQTRALATREGDILIFNAAGGWMRSAHHAAFDPIANLPSPALPTAMAGVSRSDLWLLFGARESAPAFTGKIVIVGERASWHPQAIEGLARFPGARSLLVTAERNRTVVWIGGHGHVLRQEIRADTPGPQPDAPFVRPFVSSSDDALHALAGPIPYMPGVVRFEFSSPRIGVTTPLLFQTRIAGIDSDWLPPETTGHRELNNLGNGHYRVEVRAITPTGATSAITALDFRVLPPWWRTGAAFAAAFVGMGALGFAMVRLRVRTLRRRNLELERKVSERTAELAAANAAKTEFVANMSHDIRNPLNGIVGLTLALEDTRLDSRQRDLVGTLQECATYLSSLVNDVLDFASIEAGKVELRPRAFAPRELLSSIVQTLKTDATASGAVITFVVDENLPPHVLGDAGRIQQILVNFVSNALKYAGGHVELAANLPAGAPGEVEFTVTDRGAGLSEAEQATLFTKFSRIKQTRGGEEIAGTGLGLASCRLLADLMGGSVGVLSRPGHGARFFLRLPLAAVEPVRTSKLESDLPHGNVLLVEDTDYNAWAASAVLARLGLTCERARTGAEALALAAGRRFNIVLLDRNLPDIDGLEIARRLRALEGEGGHAVLIAVTAYCTAEDRALCLAAGMDAFVGKPLTPEKLRQVLLEVGQRQLPAGPAQLDDPAPAPVDLSLLKFLADGTPAGLEVQLARFIADVDEAEAELIAASNAGDPTRVATLAHRVLGQARMIAHHGLEAAAIALERGARAGDPAMHTRLRAEVHRQQRAVRAAIRRPPAVPST